MVSGVEAGLLDLLDCEEIMTFILIKWFLLAVAGSLIPAIVLNVEKRLLVPVGIVGGLGYLAAVSATPNFGIPGFMQVFLGAVIVALLSEILARILKSPALTFCIPGIFPLVPGITAYRTMQLLAEQNWRDAASTGLMTAASAFAIAFGLMLMAAMFRHIPKKRLVKTLGSKP